MYEVIPTCRGLVWRLSKFAFLCACFGGRTFLIFGGVMRKVDKLGRIVIPLELREKYGLYEGTRIEFLDFVSEIAGKRANLYSFRRVQFRLVLAKRYETEKENK